MNDLGTVTQDFRTVMLDKQLERAREQTKAGKHGKSKPHKEGFVKREIWAKCFSGREEIGYENI